jgi:hypothetical protein
MRTVVNMPGQALRPVQIKFMFRPGMMDPANQIYNRDAWFIVSSTKIRVSGSVEVEIQIKEINTWKTSSNQNGPCLTIDASNGYFLVYFESEQECQVVDKAIEQAYNKYFPHHHNDRRLLEHIYKLESRKKK